MKVKGYLQGVALGVLGCGLLASSAVAGEEAPTAEFAVDTYSQYIWRGYAFSRDSLVIQPSMTVGWKGFSANIWGNLDTDLWGTDSKKWNETDLTLAYDWSMDDFDLGAGYIFYGLDGAEDSQEVYLTAAYNTMLTPTLTIYRDFDAYPGWYLTLGVGHSFALSDTLALDLGAQVGYMDTDGYDAFHDGQLSASISYPVGQYFTITPTLAYSFALSSEAEDTLEVANFGAIGKSDANFFYGGLSVSMAF
ncbi:MAG: hypothetical protein U5J62_07060 [Desulfurivibrio sp.]|nr:hypothetical protein [Desulfurivibrio sp.]